MKCVGPPPDSAGDTDLPQQCTAALQDPQTEVRVWLHGLGMPRDITERHTVACASPLTIGIGSESSSLQNLNSRLCLHFREHGGEERLLGEIGLRPLKTIPTVAATNYSYSVSEIAGIIACPKCGSGRTICIRPTCEIATIAITRSIYRSRRAKSIRWPYFHLPASRGVGHRHI